MQADEQTHGSSSLAAHSHRELDDDAVDPRASATSGIQLKEGEPKGRRGMPDGQSNLNRGVESELALITSWRSSHASSTLRVPRTACQPVAKVNAVFVVTPVFRLGECLHNPIFRGPRQKREPGQRHEP